MKRINISKYVFVIISVVMISGLLAGFFPALPQPVRADEGRALSPYETLVTNSDGEILVKLIFPSPPQRPFTLTDSEYTDGLDKLDQGASSKILSNVPAFDWSYGCSATSAAMLFGYYDRIGYSNMYTGPTNGGVMPLNNSPWGNMAGECPLSATHQGIDGRATKGHVDDYWTGYGNTGDPYFGNWAQHTWGDCTADYMGTNQWKYGSPISYNADGSTTFFMYLNGNPTPASVLAGILEPTDHDGAYGMTLFVQPRGYMVTSCYNQYIMGQAPNDPGTGFTFANYCTEIDAGYPVLIHLDGHTMLGYGYDTNGNKIYIHDTWDYNDYDMIWGGTYGAMQHNGVTVLHLATVAPLITNSTGASNITKSEARINGELTGNGGQDPTIHVYWGPTNGGTTTSNWANHIDLSTKAMGTFFTDISGLTAGTTYYYRCYALNSAGGTWASASTSFTTTSHSLTMAVDGSGIVSPDVGTYNYAGGTIVTITATPASNYLFIDWTGDISTVADVNAASTTITMNDDYSITAHFGQPILTITSGGNGTVDPAIGPHTYDAGQVVTITATPDVTYCFINWTGDVANTNSAITTVTMNANKTITANFARPILTINKIGNGTVLPASGQTYDAGDVVSINATEDAGWRFACWTGDTATITSTNLASTNITMNGHKTITAVFDRPILTMAVNGGGTTDPAVGPHDVYDLDSYVSINATAAANWVFDYWKITDVMGILQTLRPDSPGSETNISHQSPGSGAHWEKINDTHFYSPYNADETFLYYADDVPEVIQRDLFTIPNPTGISRTYPVDTLEVTLCVKPNTTNVKASIRTNGVTHDTPLLTSDIQGVIQYFWYSNPTTGRTWKWDEIDDLEIGVVLTGAGDNSTCYQLYAQVGATAIEVGNPDSANTTVKLSDDCTVTAHFIRTHSDLTVTAGTGGTATQSGSGNYAVGDTANITATPSSGYRFVNWTGDVGTIGDANAAATSVTMNSDYTITANFVVINTGGGGGGGGSGGGGGAASSPYGDKTTTSFGGLVSYEGILIGDMVAESFDSKATLNIARNTSATNRIGNGLTSVTIVVLNKPDAPQEGATVVGGVYEMGPKGASFNPPLTLTIEYLETNLPEGVTEDMLCVALWDEEAGAYIPVEGFWIDKDKNEIHASISHFSRYTVIAQPRPAEFTLSSLIVTPAIPEFGEDVDVSVTVTNTGDMSGTYSCCLMLNGASYATKDIPLEGGAEATIHFTVLIDKEGSYDMRIGELSQSYKVNLAAATFEVSSLTITPQEAEAGQSVDISLTAANKGGTSGVLEIPLDINGDIIETKSVTLGGGQSQKVTFSYTPDKTGKNIVQIGELLGSFTVKGQTDIQSQVPLPADSVQPTGPAETTQLENHPTPASINWALVLGIGGGIIIIALILFLILKRNFRKRASS